MSDGATTGENLAGLVLFVPAWTFQAFVCTKLWAWFIVAQFGLPQIGMAHAVGLAMLATAIHPRPTTKNDGLKLIDILLGSTKVYALIFGVGFVAKCLL